MLKLFTMFIAEEKIRRLPNIVKVCMLLVIPVIGTILLDRLWNITLAGRPVIPVEDKGVILAILALPGAIYGAIATYSVIRVWKQFDLTKDLADKVKDGQTDKENALVRVASTRISPNLHAFLGVFSIIVLFLVFLIPYNSVLTGHIAVSVISFTFIVAWRLAIELDDPICGYWIIEIGNALRKEIEQHVLGQN